MSKKEGTIKFFNESKGYGFIKQNDNEKDVFFHINGFDISPTEIVDDQKVEYEIERTKKGLQAVNITLAE